MKKKRTYSSVDVERLDVVELLRLVCVGCIVAIDVAKVKFVVAFASAAGEVLKLVRFEHPRQTLLFLGVLEKMRDAGKAPRVVMEPTGTYGDAVRHQCHARAIAVHMISPKHTHDAAELFDGVPSMHDPKAAAVLARLAAIKDLRPWQPRSIEERELRALVDRRWPLTRTLELYYGYLESMLARHWPEFPQHVSVRDQRAWMTWLKVYAGPRALVESRDEAREAIRRATRAGFDQARIEALFESARTTVGVPMTPLEEMRLSAIVEEIHHNARKLDALDEEISAKVKADEVLTRLAKVVGPACAASIASHIGSPLAYPSANAFVKAMGLNLKERSSGEKKGALRITKRGPAPVRQLLYLATLRLLQRDRVATAWYRARKSYREDASKLKAVVALMRKLASALFHVARGSEFDAAKLFDLRRLECSLQSETSSEQVLSDDHAGSAPRPPAPFTKRSRQPRQGGVHPHAE